QRNSAFVAIETKRRADDVPISPPAAAFVAVQPPEPVTTIPRRATVATAAAVSRSKAAPARVVTESIIETREIIVRESALPASASIPATAPPTLPRHRYDEQPPHIERTVVSRETHFAAAAPRSLRV